MFKRLLEELTKKRTKGIWGVLDNIRDGVRVEIGRGVLMGIKERRSPWESSLWRDVTFTFKDGYEITKKLGIEHQKEWLYMRKYVGKNIIIWSEPSGRISVELIPNAIGGE